MKTKKLDYKARLEYWKYGKDNNIYDKVCNICGVIPQPMLEHGNEYH